MGLSGGPRPACATPVVDQEKIDTSRTGILVVAFGTLFLLSQLCLIIWILARPRAFSRKKELRTSTATSSSVSDSSPDDANTNDNDSPKARRKVRSSSTWSRAALERQYLRQQGQSGGLDELVGSDTPSSSPDTDSYSDHSVQQGNRNVGMKAAMSAPPSRRIKSSPGADPEAELREFNPRKVWIEMGIVAAAIAKPRSPRSPRLSAVDQAALMEALAADDEGIDAPSPTPAVVEDAEALASGFDDSLGVNRRLASTKMNADTVMGASGSELRGRSV